MTAAQAIFNSRRRQTKEKAKAEMRRTTTQPYTAAQMFALADDIERYPQFLPWCESVQVQRQPPKTGSQQITATLHINYKGIRAAFSTENQHDKPARITMRLAKGGAALSPMAALNGEWQFANTETGGCQTTLDLHYQFTNKLMAAIFSKMFDNFFGKFADSFTARAAALYGKKQISVEVVGAGKDGNYWSKTLMLPNGATIYDAIKAAGATETTTAGIWGRQKPTRTPITEGDRIEIYEPLPTDPRQNRHFRAKNAASQKSVK